MTRLVLPISCAVLWIPAAWTTWQLEGNRFRRAAAGNIELQYRGRGPWARLAATVDDNIPMPRRLIIAARLPVAPWPAWPRRRTA